MTTDTRQPEHLTLEELRKKAGKSRDQLAKDINVSSGRIIYAYERQQAKPDVDRIIALAKVLNVSLRSLIKSLGYDVSGIPDDSETA